MFPLKSNNSSLLKKQAHTLFHEFFLTYTLPFTRLPVSPSCSDLSTETASLSSVCVCVCVPHTAGTHSFSHSHMIMSCTSKWTHLTTLLNIFSLTHMTLNNICIKHFNFKRHQNHKNIWRTNYVLCKYIVHYNYNINTLHISLLLVCGQLSLIEN